jgi:hypothetical protein
VVALLPPLMHNTHHTAWKEDPRFHIVKSYIAWYLADCVSHSKDGIDLIELVPMESKLFFHSTHVRIIEIGPIQVVQEVHQTAESEDEEVEFNDQLPFTWRSWLSSKILDERGHGV